MKKENTIMMVYSAMFVALMAISAFIQIPVPPYPVPMTLQTFFLYLCGLLLPKRRAFFTQACYVCIGLIGVPVFAKGGGISYIFDLTFGYLLAFIFMAPALSLLAEKTLYAARRWSYAFGGLAVITLLQVMGVIYMALLSGIHLGAPLAFDRAIYLIFIFIPLDCIKLGFATMLALKLRTRLPNLLPAR